VQTDERDAQLILDPLLTNRFPHIWVPTAAERDCRQLLWHRHKMVRLRTTKRENALSLMTHPGIGPVNALAFVFALGGAFPAMQTDRQLPRLESHAPFRRETQAGGDQQTQRQTKVR